MDLPPDINSGQNHDARVKRYYRFHSRIYDATRWTFLFGRDAILEMIPELPARPRILEVGCGTGENIIKLESHFPDAEILGIDLSSDMLEIARFKLVSSSEVKLRQARYDSSSLNLKPFDLILLSYSLTMFGDGIEETLEQLSNDLNPDGYVAVVDFHKTPFVWFRKWMHLNHVNLNGQLYPLIKKYFRPVKRRKKQAYLGLWSYMLFLGQPR